MKYIKGFIMILFIFAFYVILAWHGLTLGVLLAEFLCPYLSSWSWCDVTKLGEYKWDLFFILPSILFFWIYAGFVIRWNYKELPMTEIQKIFTMLFYAMVTYPFLYLAGNSLYQKFVDAHTVSFTHTFLVGTFFSILTWIGLVFIYFIIQKKKQ